MNKRRKEWSMAKWGSDNIKVPIWYPPPLLNLLTGISLPEQQGSRQTRQRYSVSNMKRVILLSPSTPHMRSHVIKSTPENITIPPHTFQQTRQEIIIYPSFTQQNLMKEKFRKEKKVKPYLLPRWALLDTKIWLSSSRTKRKKIGLWGIWAKITRKKLCQSLNKKILRNQNIELGQTTSFIKTFLPLSLTTAVESMREIILVIGRVWMPAITKKWKQ